MYEVDAWYFIKRGKRSALGQYRGLNKDTGLPEFFPVIFPHPVEGDDPLRAILAPPDAKIRPIPPPDAMVVGG